MHWRIQWLLLCRAIHPECVCNLRCYGPPEERGNRIPHLPKPMPFRDVEPKPIGIRMKSCRFPDCDASRRVRVDWSGRRECATVASRSCAKCIAQPVRVEFQKPTDRFNIPLCSLPKSPNRKRRVNCSKTRTQQLTTSGIPLLPQSLRVLARGLESRHHPIAL